MRGELRREGVTAFLCAGTGIGLCSVPMRDIRFTLIRLTRPGMAGLASLVCLGLLSVNALADNGGRTTVYRWVDPQGVVHYSDQPHPNAQKLEISGAQTFSAPPPSQTSSTAAPAPTRASGPEYDSCAITQPTDQQMLMNVYRTTAVVQTSPVLRPGDQIHLFVDGKQIPGSGTSFSFPVVPRPALRAGGDRGQHRPDRLRDAQRHLLRAPALRPEPAQPGTSSLAAQGAVLGRSFRCFRAHGGCRGR